MVRKARTKFLIFSLLGIILFFTVVFGFVRISLRNGLEHEITNELSELEDYSEQSFDVYNREHFSCLITSYDLETKEFTFKVEKTTGFTTEEVEKIITAALSKSYSYGSMKNVFYKISFNETTPQKIVAADFSESLEVYRDGINTTLFALLIIVGVIAVVTWLFSFWVFKPVEETLYKQRQFISDVSHELKTPVAIISANADVLKNNGDNEYVENIKSQSKRMGYLVNDLLTLSSLEEGSSVVKKEVFSASETVLKSILPFDAVAFEKGKFIKFDIGENVFVSGVREDLFKICEILTDNAVKYSLKGTEIVITLKKDGKKAVLSVFNRGCNVALEDKERIFERFYRADASRSRECGGSGLGLSIAKSLARRNNWKIAAKPILGESMEITLLMKEKVDKN